MLQQQQQSTWTEWFKMLCATVPGKSGVYYDKEQNTLLQYKERKRKGSAAAKALEAKIAKLQAANRWHNTNLVLL